MSEVEIWKPILETDMKYSVSNMGRIRNNRTDRLVKCCKTNTGVKTFSWHMKCTYRTISLHVLVGMYFCDNPLGLNTCYFKDGNKDNCRADNLEWISREEALKRTKENKYQW